VTEVNYLSPVRIRMGLFKFNLKCKMKSLKLLFKIKNFGRKILGVDKIILIE